MKLWLKTRARPSKFFALMDPAAGVGFGPCVTWGFPGENVSAG